MKQVSEKRKQQNSGYSKASREHLNKNVYCQICVRRDFDKDPEIEIIQKATHIHHQRGRIGRLLCDQRFFLSACDTCHPKWVHETNVADARRLGVLSAPEDWGVYPVGLGKLLFTAPPRDE